MFRECLLRHYSHLQSQRWRCQIPPPWYPCPYLEYQFNCSFMSNFFATPWTAAYQASFSITNSQSLLKLMSIQLVMLSNHLILCHPLLLLPSIFSSIRVFSNKSALRIKWPKYWSFSFNLSPSNEHPGRIFRMDWLDLLAVQGTPKSLLQHSSKASVLQRSAFCVVQLLTPIHDHWEKQPMVFSVWYS